jgi:AcrR family transcriptional regulator
MGPELGRTHRKETRLPDVGPAVAKTASARGIARKERIVDVATRFLARNGARGTTLGEIAAEAGVSQAGLLYHFPTKEELLHAVLDRRDEFEDALLWSKGSDPGLQIFDIIAGIVRSWSDRPEIVGLVAVLVAENVGDDGPLRPRLASKYQLTVDRIASTLRAAQDRGEIWAETDTHLKSIEILAFLSGLEMAWLVSPEIPAAETAAEWARHQVMALRAAPNQS